MAGLLGYARFRREHRTSRWVRVTGLFMLLGSQKNWQPDPSRVGYEILDLPLGNVPDQSGIAATAKASRCASAGSADAAIWLARSMRSRPFSFAR